MIVNAPQHTIIEDQNAANNDLFACTFIKYKVQNTSAKNVAINTPMKIQIFIILILLIFVTLLHEILVAFFSHLLCNDCHVKLDDRILNL